LVRSNRKTAAIYIRNGEVEVRAPLRMAKWEIECFMLSKEKWILSTLSKQRAHAEKKASFVVDYGSVISLFGEPYVIAPGSVISRSTIVPHEEASMGFDDRSLYLPSGLSPKHVKAHCIKAYKDIAKTHITSCVDFYAAKMGVTPSAVKINSAKTRWGSCSYKKSLNFSWRLVMAEEDVIDYVVVHELAHLVEMNHSARFWAVVAGVLPDYKGRIAQLKLLQKKLAGEDWD